MRSLLVGLIGCTTAVVNLIPSAPVTAQRHITVTPHLGMYLPIGPLMDESGRPLRTVRQSGVASDYLVAERTGSLRKRQVGSALAGIRVGVDLSQVVAWEVGLAYAPSMVAVSDDRTTKDYQSRVLFGSARALLRLNQEMAGSFWTFHLSSGVGMVARGGEIWSGTSGTTDGALVLGFGAQLRSGDWLRFRFELEDYVSNVRFDRTSSGRTTARVHNDLTWSIGAALPLGW